MKEVYRYTFDDSISLCDVESSLLMAIVSVEALHGESQVQLEVEHLLDADSRTCVVDASTQVGKELNRLLVGYLRREFGEDTFSVKRAEPAASAGV